MKGLLICVALLVTALLNAQSDPAKRIVRDSFSLKYPTDWTIDTVDEDYDPDTFFSIDSPGDNTIMFFLLPADTDQTELLNAQLESFSSHVIKKPEITEFAKWGAFQGTGRLLKGKILGIFKGFVRVFIYGDSSRTLLVVEQCYDKDYQKLQKGFELISSSFRFK